MFFAAIIQYLITLNEKLFHSITFLRHFISKDYYFWLHAITIRSKGILNDSNLLVYLEPYGFLKSYNDVIFLKKIHGHRDSRINYGWSKDLNFQKNLNFQN